MKFLSKLLAPLQSLFLKTKKKRKPFRQKAKVEEVPLEYGSEQDHSIIYYIFEPLERIKKRFRGLLESFIEDSIALATNNLPEADRIDPPPSELAIRETGHATIFEIYSLLKGYIGLLYNLAYKAMHEFVKFFSDGIRNINELRAWNKEKEEIERNSVNSFYEGKTNHLQFLIDDRKERIKKADENIVKLAHQLKITPSVTHIKEVGGMFYVWNAVIILCELAANISALQILRESMFLVATLALGLGILIFLGADFSGKMLKSYNVTKEKKHLMIPLFVSLAVLVLCLFLGASRLLYIQEETGRELAFVLQFGLVSINVVLYIVSLFLSYSMFHPDLPRVKEYNHLQKYIARYKKEIKKWTDEIAVIKKEWQKKLLEIRIKYEELDKEIVELANNIKNAKANYANRINMVCALLFETAKQIDAETKGATYSSRQKNYENRADKQYCEYYKITVKDLCFENDLYEMFYPFLEGEKNMLFQKKGYSIPQSQLDEASADSIEVEEAPEIESEKEMAQEPEPESKTESEPVSESTPEPETEPEYESEPEPETAPEPESKTETKNESESEPESEPEIKQDEMEDYKEFVTNLGDIHQKVNDTEKINEMLNIKNGKKMKKDAKSKKVKKTNGHHIPLIIDPVKPLLLLIVALIVFGCNQDVQHTFIKFDNDQTPEATVVRENITTQKLLKLMKIDLDDNRYNGATVEISVINDVSRNETMKAELSVGSMVDNKFTRRDEIKAFSDAVNGHLDWAFSINSYYNYSKIASAMAKSLNKLASVQADKKIYIVASDMMQNTKDLSFYSTLPGKDNYEKLMSHFESKNPLSDLSGIKIIIINKPTDADIDDLINAAIAFWSYYFTKKGANVEVVANL